MTEPPWVLPRAAYVHVPFCAHHCGYCDFAVVVGRDDQISQYLDALEAELTLLGAPRPVETLFLGGGTPSHLDVRLLERLLRMLWRWFPPAVGPGGPSGPGATHRSFLVHPETPTARWPVATMPEFTIEANPESLTAEKIALLAEHGVNRVSLGAQSFNPATLAVLERAHRPDETAHAVERLRGRINNVSLDLIFAAPGQTLDAWKDDLRRALDLGPAHVSTYGLTYEKGTRLWKQRRAGLLRSLDEDAELEMYRVAIDTLEAHGLEHYEISNFARPGCRSRHNQVYWANHAYFGVGLGAARYVRGRREVNTRDFTAYLTRTLAGEVPTQTSEELPPLERAKETMAVQLRRFEGIDRAAFRQQTGFVLDAIAPRLADLVEQGLLIDTGSAVFLSRPGKYVADGVIERLL